MVWPAVIMGAGIALDYLGSQQSAAAAKDQAGSIRKAAEEEVALRRLQERQQLEQARKISAAQRSAAIADMGAAGVSVSSQSAIDVLSAMVYEQELDQGALRLESDIAESRIRRGAEADAGTLEAQAKGQQLGGFGSLLGGIGGMLE